jgi:hypothetical protein
MFFSFSRTNLIILEHKKFFETYVEKINDDSEKLAFLVLESDIQIDNAMLGFNPKILNERFIGTTVSIGIGRNNFLFHLVDGILSRLISVGIPQHLKKFHTEVILRIKSRMAPIRDGVKDSFTLEDLDYGFVIWLIASAISIFVFFFELLLTFVKYLISSVRNFVGLIFVSSFLMKYFQ